MAAMQLHWDIFCRVIDNYGDIGICWRLARQLVVEHGRHVRLWVDDLASLRPLCPAIDTSLGLQSAQGVEIRHWGTDVVVERSADVVIEAFACELPDSYLKTMAAATPKPCWINLEYLTAESWAEDCHGMASPHPTLPLTKYFFFPGFTAKTGGLLREASLLAGRERCQKQLPIRDYLEISLFCYDTAPVGDLLAALAQLPQPSLVHVPPGKPLAAFMQHLPGTGPWQHGNARIEPIPFMPMDDYDHLLWRCDINFVRGEDSFVRAQWAAKPFVWQIYQQDADAHLVKLSAFLDRYCAAMGDIQAQAIRETFVAWNGGETDLGKAFQHFVDNRQIIAEDNRAWCQHLAAQDDLATALVNFCASKV
ncbi:MAG TPA: elongation factor P maturation arginine rhamnosyltransferase EarP [Azonexus sp.]|nr:elongation factor P maturation arginine rhamnosyltransferase EarP [Azonexus sp.]